MRRDVLAEIHHHFIHEAPAPAICRIESLHHWMARCMEVLGRMSVRGGIAAANVPAHAAQSEVNPAAARLQTFFATVRGRRHFAELIQMSALAGHRSGSWGGDCSVPLAVQGWQLTLDC
jgi:hypothetical protein